MNSLVYLDRGLGHLADTLVWDPDRAVRAMPCAPVDEGRVMELVRETEGAESAAIARFWLDRQPEAFTVYRSIRSDDITAFSAFLRLSGPEGEDVDPVVAAAWAHARADSPLRAGEHMAISRFMVDPQAYQRPSPSLNLVTWRVTAEIIRADRLAWLFVVMRDDGFWNAHLEPNMMATDAGPVVGDHGYRLFAQDWRTRSAMAWVAERHEAMQEGAVAVTSAVAPPQERRDQVVLSRAEFDTAVRDALRVLWWPAELAANPLSRSRLVVEHGRSLHAVLLLAIDTLREERGGETRHRVLTTTYSKAAPTQEAAARRLGMSFSTYRRQLTAGVRHVKDVLWSMN
ncbi:hypothetical protein [Streptomyces adelaidensis]|uniref:hypothetical protein n=1 Tax=Streptomyces adelaidensis TaxID=2796465 RepID=UPI001F20E20E|nr:hypothetical protein [Streptomyces adelaidensis]